MNTKVVQYYVAKRYPIWYNRVFSCKLEEHLWGTVSEFAPGVKVVSSFSGAKLGEVSEAILT
jgi:hypothetical protein